jgi:hypothetical protein
MTGQDYDTLARHDLNGRQIKNIIKVDLKQLQQIAKI